MRNEDFQERMEQIKAENRAQGVCEDCGGAGVVADLVKINRTHDPHINRPCRTCRGTGKPKEQLKPR